MKAPNKVYVVTVTNMNENQFFTSLKEARQFLACAKEDAEFWGDDPKAITLTTFVSTAAKNSKK